MKTSKENLLRNGVLWFSLRSIACVSYSFVVTHQIQSQMLKSPAYMSQIVNKGLIKFLKSEVSSLP